MLNFLKKVAAKENQPITKMSAANIAMVFAPNFVRCPSDDPVVIFENTKYIWLTQVRTGFSPHSDIFFIDNEVIFQILCPGISQAKYISNFSLGYKKLIWRTQDV